MVTLITIFWDKGILITFLEILKKDYKLSRLEKKLGKYTFHFSFLFYAILNNKVNI